MKSTQKLKLLTIALTAMTLTTQAQLPSDFVRAKGQILVTGLAEDTVWLRGINLDNEWLIDSFGNITLDDPLDQYQPMWNRFSQADYQRISNDFCMNTIRMGLNYRMFEDNANPFVYKAAAWTWLDQQILWAKNNNIYLILDMHIPQGGTQPCGGCGYRQWDEPVMQQRFKALWYEIALRYSNETTIAGYDLMNEPNPTNNAMQWQILAQETLDTIRLVDNNHLIVVEEVNSIVDSVGYTPPFNDTLFWQAQQFNFLVNDTNVMYDFHFYEPTDYALQQTPWFNPNDEGAYPDNAICELLEDTTICRNRDGLDYRIWFRTDLMRNNNVPMNAGEFAPSLPTFKNNYGGDIYTGDVMDLMKKYNMNYTYYTYHAIFEDYNGLADTLYNLMNAFSQEFCTTTGVNELDVNNSKQLKVYPNPFTDLITIEAIDFVFSNATLKLYNLLGEQVVHVGNIKGNKVTLTLDNLVNGIYLYQLTDKKGLSINGKIILE